MKRDGFTLVELVIALTIFTLILSSIFYVLGVELRFWKKIVAAAEKQQIANMVMARIIADTRSSGQILSPSSAGLLRLKVGSDTIEYSIKNNKIRRKKNNYSSYLTDVGDLEKLSFSYPAPKLVGILVGDFSSKARLRN